MTCGFGSRLETVGWVADVVYLELCIQLDDRLNMVIDNAEREAKYN